MQPHLRLASNGQSEPRSSEGDSPDLLIHLPRIAHGSVVDLPVQELEALAHQDRWGVHRLVSDPLDADVIVFSQCHMLPQDWRLKAILDHPLVSIFRDKIMLYNERYKPWCAMPGVYVSMPRKIFNPMFQKAWSYFPRINHSIVDVIPSPVETDFLFSFVGTTRSHRCRKPLPALRHAHGLVEDVRVFSYYDATIPGYAEARSYYRDILLRSRFVLCPRGLATSSMRLYETLAAGRVPVIISDDWVEPAGPAWNEFSIRWPESRTNGLIDLLEERDVEWPRMSQAARFAYEEFFAPSVAFHRLGECFSALLESAEIKRFPRGGIRNRAFVAAGINVARWRTTTPARRFGKRTLRRFGLVR